jgi:hypothetical protein
MTQPWSPDSNPEGGASNVQGSTDAAAAQQQYLADKQGGLAGMWSQFTGQGKAVVGPNAAAYNQQLIGAENYGSEYQKLGGDYTQQGATINAPSAADVQSAEANLGGLGGYYQNMLAGKGPSVAQNQFQAATDQSIANQMAMARSARGSAAQAGALREATAQGGAQMAGAAAQSGVIRAQEQQQAAQGLGQVYGQQGQLGLGLYGQQAGLASQQAQLQQANQAQINQMRMGYLGMSNQEQQQALEALSSYTRASLAAQGQQLSADQFATQTANQAAGTMASGVSGMMSDVNAKTMAHSEGYAAGLSMSDENAKQAARAEGMQKGLAASQAQGGGTGAAMAAPAAQGGPGAQGMAVANPALGPQTVDQYQARFMNQPGQKPWAPAWETLANNSSAPASQAQQYTNPTPGVNPANNYNPNWTPDMTPGKVSTNWQSQLNDPNATYAPGTNPNLVNPNSVVQPGGARTSGTSLAAAPAMQRPGASGMAPAPGTGQGRPAYTNTYISDEFAKIGPKAEGEFNSEQAAQDADYAQFTPHISSGGGGGMADMMSQMQSMKGGSGKPGGAAADPNSDQFDPSAMYSSGSGPDSLNYQQAGGWSGVGELNPGMGSSEGSWSNLSDERVKKNIRHTLADEFLEHLHPSSYQYKNPRDEPRPIPTGGRYLGAMAQDIESTPEVGHQIIVNTPRGKMVAPKAALSAALAGLGRLAERVAFLEGKGKHHG